MALDLIPGILWLLLTVTSTLMPHEFQLHYMSISGWCQFPIWVGDLHKLSPGEILFIEQIDWTANVSFLYAYVITRIVLASIFSICVMYVQYADNYLFVTHLLFALYHLLCQFNARSNYICVFISDNPNNYIAINWSMH